MILKWLFDRTVSFVGLLFLWPILIVVALLIRAKMPGDPAFFTQKRVGRNGRLFTMYKFRTMKPTPIPSLKGRGNGQSWSTVSVAGESRITPLGAKLRRYKIDELPELWNVLKGDMSFVGPRPDVPGYADALVGEDRDVLKLRPGITGPASLKYRDEEEMLREFVAYPHPLPEGKGVLDGLMDQELAVWYNDNVIYPDKVRLNLYYLNHYSFIKDIQMIFCTVLGKRMRYAGEEI